MKWLDITTAPKGATADNPCKEHWILGVNKFGQQRVIKWSMEYPYINGTWVYAYVPTDDIDDMLTFEPVAWMPLPAYNGE